MKSATEHIPKQCLDRLRKEYLQIVKAENQHPNIICKPLDSNLLEWHYVIHSIQDIKSPYHNGTYHGKLVFPSQYPFKPPSIYMITPSGRFKPNTRLCLSMSDFHPESWSPQWSVLSILTGLLSFMLDNEQTFGSIETSEEEKKDFAKKSMDFNCKDELFVQLFPDLVKQHKKKLKKSSKASSSSTTLQNSQQQQQSITLNQSQMTGYAQSILQFILFVIICVALLYLFFNYF